MKNRPPHHEISFFYVACFPTGCKLGGSVLILALLGVFNFWWFLLPQSNSHLHHHLYSGAAAQQKIAALCNSQSSCDIFNGKWVPDPSPPPYTNATCPFIFFNQDCMTNGRPDRGFLHWRWQPDDCDIPAFDPALFLHLMAGKSMVFVGDSLARNHLQSLLCLLSQVETPKRPTLQSLWIFPSYKFKLALAWSPFLVNFTEKAGTWKIHVDRLDKEWASSLAKYDIAVFNTLNWYFRRSTYYLNGERISDYDPSSPTDIQYLIASMKLVWSNVWDYLLENFKGVVVLRSVSVSHFDANPWDKGGTCYKTQPDFDPHRNISLPWVDNEILKLQKEKFREAVEMAKSYNSPCRLRLLDVTYSTLLRPDGHPGIHRIQSPGEPRHDCTHWCMPGPIDSWNQLLFADPHVMCSRLEQ